MGFELSVKVELSWFGTKEETDLVGAIRYFRQHKSELNRCPKLKSMWK